MNSIKIIQIYSTTELLISELVNFLFDNKRVKPFGRRINEKKKKTKHLCKYLNSEFKERNNDGKKSTKMSDKKLNDTQEIAIISDNGNSDVNVIIENHTEINNHPSVDTSNVINLSTHPIPSSSSSSQNVRIEDVTEQNINDLNGIHITPHLTRRTSTETHSINSNNVSIKTLDENDHSSVSDSDSDVENVNMNESDFQSASNGMVLVNNSIDPKKLSQSNILCTNNETSKANIGSIAIQNSSDITFGDKTFINGPVTIKQFLMDEGTNKWKKSDGFENPAFSNSADDVNQRNGKSPKIDLFFFFWIIDFNAH